MKPFVFLLVIYLSMPASTFAQDSMESGPAALDSLYREDQFYLGFTYNILLNLHDDLSSSGFSGGMELGFIRDLPINERRNISLGIGLGWALNTYGQTLFIGEEAATERTIFTVLDSRIVNYDRNRFTTQSLELPLQLRWRTSTMESHKFWRVYSGLQLGYIYHFRSIFEQPGNTVNQTDVPEFNRLRLGATFAFGYNTFNFYFHYELNPFFDKNVQIEGSEVGFNSLRVGLMFYIF